MPHHIGYLIATAIALLIIGGVLRVVTNARREIAILRAMGFTSVPREQAFANWRAISDVLMQDFHNTCRVPGHVEKGQTALGETVLFNLPWDDNTNSPPALNTITGVRVAPALPDFMIGYVSGRKLNAMLNRAAHAVLGKLAANTTPPVIEIADATFAEHHRVYGHDATGVRAMLTPAFTAAMASAESGNLRARKSGEWLFIYAAGLVKPRNYPQWLQDTVALVQKLDLHPDAASSAPAGPAATA